MLSARKRDVDERYVLDYLSRGFPAINCMSPASLFNGLGMGLVTSLSPLHVAQPACQGVASGPARRSLSDLGRKGKRRADSLAGSAVSHAVPATARPWGGRRGDWPWSRSCPSVPGWRRWRGAGWSVALGDVTLEQDTPQVVAEVSPHVTGAAALSRAVSSVKCLCYIPSVHSVCPGGAPRSPSGSCWAPSPPERGLGASAAASRRSRWWWSLLHVAPHSWWPASPRSPSRPPGEDGGTRTMGTGRPRLGRWPGRGPDLWCRWPCRGQRQALQTGWTSVGAGG